MTHENGVPSLQRHALEAVRRAATEAPQWFDGKPARRLLAYVPPMEQARRVAPIDAVSGLLMPLAEHGASSLLVLHPVRPAERLSTYALRKHQACGGWGLEELGVDMAHGGPLPRLHVTPGPVGASRFTFNLSGVTAKDAEQGAIEWLLGYWLQRLKVGRIDGLDQPPGLPSGAVLGVLETDAEQLWPDLFDTTARQVHAPMKASPALALKIARVAGEVWTVAQQEALLEYFDARKRADPRLKVETLHSEMGEACFVSASAIKGQLGVARKRREQSRQGYQVRRTV